MAYMLMIFRNIANRLAPCVGSQHWIRWSELHCLFILIVLTWHGAWSIVVLVWVCNLHRANEISYCRSLHTRRRPVQQYVLHRCTSFMSFPISMRMVPPFIATLCHHSLTTPKSMKKIVILCELQNLNRVNSTSAIVRLRLCMYDIFLVRLTNVRIPLVDVV